MIFIEHYILIPCFPGPPPAITSLGEYHPQIIEPENHLGWIF